MTGKAPDQNAAKAPDLALAVLNAIQNPVILVDAEWMSIATLSGSNATFKRGLWGTTPVAHSPAAPITSFGPLANKLRVARAALGTTAAGHSNGAPIYDADGLGAFTAAISGPNDGTYIVRAVYIGGMLTSTGRTASCPTATTGATTANNGQLQIAFANKVLKGDIEPGFTIDLCYKDIGLAMAAAAEQRIGLPVGAAAYSVVGSARATPYASKDYSALLHYACDLAGIEHP